MDNDEIYHDQVIEAAFLHSKPRCFYIGPFARRVSFASQQFRALDLIAAFNEKRRLEQKKATKQKQRVAVIGAGIAGLTITAALRGFSCQVDLYEREEEPLQLQKDASHRLVHPTISRWPAGQFELTTNFTFLDWFAAPSSEVIACLREEWDKRLRLAGDDRSFAFYGGVTVTGLLTRDEEVAVKFTTERKDVPTNVVYDYVFVTTGFDEEERSKALKDERSKSKEGRPGARKYESYWERDEIESWRGNKKEVFVSGCGDGGLIDALRLVHADFNMGWLAIRVAEMFGDQLKDEIIAAENDALMAAKSLACMKLTDGKHEITHTGDPNRKVGARYEDSHIVRKLTQFYTDLVVQRLPQEISKVLNDSIDKAGVGHGWVTLISRQVQPFGPYAAPIHKIMIMQAMRRFAIHFRQGELITQGDARSIRWMDDAGGETVITDDVGLIVRHGSPANLCDLSEAECNSLRVRQFMLADYIASQNKRQLPPPLGYPDKSSLDEPVQRQQAIGLRYNMARKLVDALEPGATVTATPAKFTFTKPEIAPIDRHPVGVKMPGEIFGIGLEEANLPEVTPL